MDIRPLKQIYNNDFKSYFMFQDKVFAILLHFQVAK